MRGGASIPRTLGRPIRTVLRSVGLDIVRYEVVRPGDGPRSGDPLPGPSLDPLRQRYPFVPPPPSVEPFLPPEPPNGRDLVEDLIRERAVRVVLEIGSFLGGSTLRWLGAAPQVVVVCVDPWGDGWAGNYLQDIGFATQRERFNAPDALYETFLANVLPFRERVIPVREASPMVLDALLELGLRPDLAFIDASKLTGDLATTHELWPNAILTGDDWSYPSDDPTEADGRRPDRYPMRDAVLRFAARRGSRVVRKSETWWIESP